MPARRKDLNPPSSTTAAALTEEHPNEVVRHQGAPAVQTAAAEMGVDVPAVSKDARLRSTTEWTSKKLMIGNHAHSAAVNLETSNLKGIYLTARPKLKILEGG